MNNKDIAFNIKIMSPDRESIRGMLPVSTMDMYDNNTGDYHPQGLYSNVIFGRVGTDLRNESHGFINLRTSILHPKLFDELIRLKGLYRAVMSGSEFAVWDKKKRDFIKSDMLDGETGYAFFKSHFEELNLVKNKSVQRAARIDLLNKYRKSAYADFQVVAPAGLRDAKTDETGRTIEVDVNKTYRRIMALASTIPETLIDSEDTTLDRTRYSLQLAINELWKYHVMLIGGKNGFLEAKFGSRKVEYGTTNVMSSMDPASADMNGATAMDVTNTQIGLHQFLKSTEPMAVGYYIPHGIAEDVYINADGDVELIEPKTLTPVSVKLSEKERTLWGTEEGLSTLINNFDVVDIRHEPVMIAGKYLAMIYRDRKNFKVIRDMESVPDRINRAYIKPLTWAEFFYITAMSYENKARAYVNRYPIVGTGSIYFSKMYLKTTIKGVVLREMTDDFLESTTNPDYPEFPDTENKGSFMDTTAPHVSQLANLKGDYDGDRSSTTAVTSDEAVKEVDDKINDPATHLTPDGGLVQPSDSDIIDWVFKNFTGFKDYA